MHDLDNGGKTPGCDRCLLCRRLCMLCGAGGDHTLAAIMDSGRDDACVCGGDPAVIFAQRCDTAFLYEWYGGDMGVRAIDRHSKTLISRHIELLLDRQGDPDDRSDADDDLSLHSGHERSLPADT